MNNCFSIGILFSPACVAGVIAAAGQGGIQPAYPGPANLRKAPVVHLEIHPLPKVLPLDKSLPIVIRNAGPYSERILISLVEKVPVTRGGKADYDDKDCMLYIFGKHESQRPMFLVRSGHTIALRWNPLAQPRVFIPQPGHMYVLVVSPASAEAYGGPYYSSTTFRVVAPTAEKKGHGGRTSRSGG